MKNLSNIVIYKSISIATVLLFIFCFSSCTPKKKEEKPLAKSVLKFNTIPSLGAFEEDNETNKVVNPEIESDEEEYPTDNVYANER